MHHSTGVAWLLVGIFVSFAAGAAPLSPAGAVNVEIDAGRVIGKINEGLLGVNHGPLAVFESGVAFTGNNAVDLSDRYKEIGIRSVRLDEFGAIDIKSLFPDFTADPDKPENYVFNPADTYLKAIHDIGAEIVFRMGYSEKPKRVDPPSDFDKWSNVMVHVAKHYNEGWAEGHRWGIRHWEVWNEPSGLGWTGTLPEYFRLYQTVAKALKAYDSNLLVGGPTLGSPDPQKDKAWGEGFIRMCAEAKVPIDFFSYHLYFTRPQEQIEHAVRHRRNLDAAGFHETKLFLTEWGWLSGRAYPPPAEDLASAKDAAADVAAMTILHDRVAKAHFYVGGAMADYPWGLFDFVRDPGIISAKPRKSFYAFKAYRTLTEHPDRLQCRVRPSVEEGGCAVLAGMSSYPPGMAILLSNYGADVTRYGIQIKSLPWTAPVTAEVFLLDGEHNLESVDVQSFQPGGNLAIEVSVELDSVCLVRLVPKIS